MGEAVDTFAELTRLHSEQDDTNKIHLDRHTTTYANGERIVEYEFTVVEDEDYIATIMLTAEQMRRMCAEMMHAWYEEQE